MNVARITAINKLKISSAASRRDFFIDKTIFIA